MNLIRKFITIFFYTASLLSLTSYADELFNDNVAREYKNATKISDESTIGGRPIYLGARHWMVIKGESTDNNVRIKLGKLHLISPVDSEYFAEMTLMVSLNQGNSYFTGEPCKDVHLVKVDKGGGRYDDCMTIDPYPVIIQGKNLTTLLIGVRNSQQGARLYDMRLLLNLANLGFPETGVHEWTDAAINKNPEKKVLIAKITNFAKDLQAAVDKANDYAKPKNAFAQLPTISQLLATLGRSDAISPVSTSQVKTELPALLISAPALPVISPPITAKVTIEQRLTELKALLDKRLITKDQYENKSSEIIRDF